MAETKETKDKVEEAPKVSSEMPPDASPTLRTMATMPFEELPPAAQACVLLIELLTLVVEGTIGMPDAGPMIASLYKKLPFRAVEPQQVQAELLGRLRQGVAVEEM